MDFICNWNKTDKKYILMKTSAQIRTSINEAKKCCADYNK